jgi:hypothetical protein
VSVAGTAATRGDLAVKRADRAARGAACSGDGDAGTGRGAIKRQDAIMEVFVQQALDCRRRAEAATFIERLDELLPDR